MIVLLSSSLLILSACGGVEWPPTSPEPGNPETETNSENEDTGEKQASSASSETKNSATEASQQSQSANSHIFDKLITEETFNNEFGYQAWQEYKNITSQYTLADYETLEGEGSSPEEIKELMSEDIQSEEIDYSESSINKILLYRFPDEEGGEYSEVSDFLSEIAFFFSEDELIYSSVTPGYFELNTETHDSEMVVSATNVSDLESLNPQVYTVAEVNLAGEILNQIMVPGLPADQNNQMMNAIYFFGNIKGNFHNTLPFLFKK